MAAETPGTLPVVEPQDGERARRAANVARNAMRGLPAPSMRDVDALNTLRYDNAARRLRPRDYHLIRTTENTFGAHDSLGAELARLRPWLFGPVAGVDPNSAESDDPLAQSELARWLQKAFDLSLGLDVMQREWVWAFTEEVLFWQVRWRWVEGFGLAPDLQWGMRRAVHAGGELLLHPDHVHVIQRRRQPSAVSPGAEAEIFTPQDWIVFKPNADGRPAGAGFMAVMMYRLAELYQTGDIRSQTFSQSMSLPIMIFQWLADALQRGQQAARDEDIADELELSEMTELLVLGHDGNRTIMDILKFPTDGPDWLNQRETRLEGRALKLLMGTALLSDTRASGPTGSSYQARTTANARVVPGASTFAGHMHQLIAHIIRVNEEFAPGSVPKLKPGEMPPRVMMVAPANTEGDTDPAEDALPVRPPENQPTPEGKAPKETDSDEVE